jgi:hypothetical protein
MIRETREEAQADLDRYREAWTESRGGATWLNTTGLNPRMGSTGATFTADMNPVSISLRTHNARAVSGLTVKMQGGIGRDS